MGSSVEVGLPNLDRLGLEDFFASGVCVGVVAGADSDDPKNEHNTENATMAISTHPVLGTNPCVVVFLTGILTNFHDMTPIPFKRYITNALPLSSLMSQALKGLWNGSCAALFEIEPGHLHCNSHWK
jgi:hypothetical protein